MSYSSEKKITLRILNSESPREGTSDSSGRLNFFPSCYITPFHTQASSFILAITKHECLRKHSRMSYTLPIALQNGTYFFERGRVDDFSLFHCLNPCVRVGNDVSEWFPDNVRLRQGCVMSPWLFNVYMDGVVREMNFSVLLKGLELLSANGGKFEINQLLFADDTALEADSRSCVDW